MAAAPASFTGVPSAGPRAAGGPPSFVAVLRASPVTHGMTALCVLFYMFASAFSWAPAMIALVPANTIMVHFRVWNVFTAGLYQSSLPKLLVGVPLLYVLGRRIEPRFGTAEFLRFVALVNLANGVCTAVCFFGLYVLSRSMRVLFVHISGVDGLVVAMLGANGIVNAVRVFG